MEVGVNAARRLSPINTLRQFFANNPDEELTASDVEVKFSVSATNAYQIVWRLVALGELAVIRKEGRICFYGRAA